MGTVALALTDLWPCFEGIIPATIATCAKDGTPNISYVSQVHYVDPEHVAISFQFFNKTRKNIAEHPFASVMVLDPRAMQAYRLSLRYERSESSGPLFQAMSLQLQAIASHAGMSDVFRLRAADIYAVLRIERVEGFTSWPLPAQDERPPAVFIDPNLHALRVVAERLNRAECLGELLETALHCLDEFFGLRHTMLLLVDEKRRALQTIASRGYPENGVGSEVGFGEGLIGMVATAKFPLRLSGLDHTLRYARAVRDRAEAVSGPDAVCREIPLPGLSNASTQIAVPLMIRNRCLGVLVAETLEPFTLLIREEAVMAIVAAHLSAGIEQSVQEPDEPVEVEASVAALPSTASPLSQRSFCFYHADDCIFVDGDYLIKNVPGRILWRILKQHQDERRVEFTNRELRMDSWLGLPEWKDNFETRLILLRKRLEQKCPDVRLVPRGRGRFALETSVKIILSEKPA
ncbi:MAG: GAF domain-containing protein [Nitrospira sp.]|nr:GAF domain-containing protein [Nitrospira sp.]